MRGGPSFLCVGWSEKGSRRISSSLFYSLFLPLSTFSSRVLYALVLVSGCQRGGKLLHYDSRSVLYATYQPTILASVYVSMYKGWRNDEDYLSYVKMKWNGSRKTLNVENRVELGVTESRGLRDERVKISCIWALWWCFVYLYRPGKFTFSRIATTLLLYLLWLRIFATYILNQKFKT